MSYSVSTAKAELEGLLHGTTLNQIQNVNGIFNRAARQLLLDCDPQETKRTLEFTQPIFNTVFDYPIAADVKGNKIIDIFPQVQRIPRDAWLQSYNQAFDIAKQNIYSATNMFTMNFNTGLKTIRINAPYLNPPVFINTMEGTDINGTWTAAGTASNLQDNNTNYVYAGGSLQFDVTIGAAYLENSTMSAVNLSEVENQSYLFAWVYIPDASKLTSVNLRWGSSSSDYWSLTVTQNQATAFVDGWNQCQFIWSSASSTGTPDSSAIDYLRLTLNVTGSMSGCLANACDSILGTVLSYEYYSKYLFRDSTTGAFQETVTDDSNLINLDTDSYNLYLFLVAYYSFQQQQGSDALAYDGQFSWNEYQRILAQYKLNYRSEIQKPQSSYYTPSQPGYGRYYGRGWNR